MACVLCCMCCADYSSSWEGCKVITELNDTMKELAIFAYQTKKNVFMYRNQGFHLCFITQRFQGSSKDIALEVRTCDYAAGKWIAVGTVKL